MPIHPRLPAALLVSLLAAPVLAADQVPVAQVNTGDTAWLLSATALVLLMTLPGLALFYAGMVRKKNILAIMAQTMACAALVTLLWFLCGYSLAFEPGPGGWERWIGGLGGAGLGTCCMTRPRDSSVFTR